MIIFILAISGYWLWKSYNVLIVSLENCKAAFSNIDTELARRFDLYIKATAILKNGSVSIKVR